MIVGNMGTNTEYHIYGANERAQIPTFHFVVVGNAHAHTRTFPQSMGLYILWLM